MTFTILAIILFIFRTAFSDAAIIPAPSEKYPFQVDLGPNGSYWLYWKHGQGNITFEIIVKTTNWVGLGFSSNGKMKGADIVVGSANANKMRDMHGSLEDDGHTTPIEDPEQNYNLKSNKLVGEWTVLKFSRKIDTCDKNDMNLDAGTIRVIWAIGSRQTLSYHGIQNKGMRSVSLLAVAKTIKLEPHINVSVLNDGFVIPQKRTTYWCKAISLKQLGIKERYQIIRYEPQLKKGNEALVHHIVIYWCYHDVNETYHGYGHECYTRNMPGSLLECRAATIAWAVGEREFNFPKEAGLPIGGPNDAKFFLMEVHYDNPGGRKGVVDSSGLKFSLTKQFRKYDAAMLMVGRHSDSSLQIPPQSKEFWAVSHCPKECINAGLKDANRENIHVFANLLHTHLTGRKLRSYQVRNGVEIGTFGNDELYDFNFQETRVLDPPIVVQKGDDIIVECGYQTMDRDKVTPGGLSSETEMCYNFMLYYPKTPLRACFTTPALWNSLFTKVPCAEEEPEVLYAYFRRMAPIEWNDTLRDVFQYYDANSQYNTDCLKTNNDDYGVTKGLKPVNIKTYMKKESKCPNKPATYNQQVATKIKSDKDAERIIIETFCARDETVVEGTTTSTTKGEKDTESNASLMVPLSIIFTTLMAVLFESFLLL